MKYRVFTRTQIEEYVHSIFLNSRILMKIVSVELLEETLFATWNVGYTIEDANPSPTVPISPIHQNILIEQRMRKKWPSGQKEYYLVPKQGTELPKGYKSVYAENAALKENAINPKDSEISSHS